ncbi:MAG: helix-turn-helix transcriptional regulator, partial [Selenomonadaceae bacterium]|nr:helix-turn-helix transcriptional regulator [Selenomonadaceae bacterium]
LARLRKKINQAEVAAKLELTPAAYSNYERGVRDLPMFTIYRLTQILNVTADELFGIKK